MTSGGPISPPITYTTNGFSVDLSGYGMVTSIVPIFSSPYPFNIQITGTTLVASNVPCSGNSIKVRDQTGTVWGFGYNSPCAPTPPPPPPTPVNCIYGDWGTWGKCRSDSTQVRIKRILTGDSTCPIGQHDIRTCGFNWKLFFLILFTVSVGMLIKIYRS
jgi:hypothetical protein